MKGLILEVASLSALGGFFGWAAGLAASWLALPYFTEMAVGRELHPELLVFAVGAAVMIGTASSIYPALRASHLDPSDAVRAI
jgi:putative ABC transport system permease protein